MPRFTPEQMDEEVKRFGYENYPQNGEPAERPYGQSENFTDSLHRSIYGGGVQEATPIPAQEDVGQYGQGMPIQDATPIPTQKDVGQYSNGMPVQDATPIPEQGNMKSYGPGAAFYPDGSQDYTDPARYYNNDPRFSKSAGKVITTPSLIDPNLGVSDRDPRDYSSASDPKGVNADRRAMTRDYLSQKYGQAANSDKYDDAVSAQDRTNTIATIGHGVDRMLMAHSAARGGPGADAGFWQGMKRDAAGRTQDAGDARKQKISDYLMKQRMGNEGVAQIDQIRNSDQQAAMYDPNSGVSRATRSGFKQVFPNEAAAYPDLEQMNAIDIERLVKGYEAKAKRDTENTMRTAQAAQWNSDAKLKADMAGTLKNKAEAEVDYLKARAGQADRMPQARAPQQVQAQIPGQPVKPKINYSPVDRDYAKDYNEWTGRGQATYQKNRGLLQRSLDTLKSLKDNSMASGRLAGTAPDWLRSDESIRLQSDIREAAQGALKGTLGPQFTEREGERIMNAAYNPKLPPSENAAKVQRALNEVDGNARLANSKAKHWEKRGTLDGYESEDITKPKENNAESQQGQETKKIGDKTYIKVNGGWKAQ